MSQSKMDEKIKLASVAFISSVAGSFFYLYPEMSREFTYVMGSVLAYYTIVIIAFSAGLVSGGGTGFLVWLLFRISKAEIRNVHYILIFLLGFFIGLSFMRFAHISGMLQ